MKLNLDNKDSPLKAYIVAGHLAWVIITPLVVFIGGGSWLVDRFGWDNRIKIVFVMIGLVVMILSTASYFIQIIKMYDCEKPPPKDKNDYDY
jgi:hypothetical protein